MWPVSGETDGNMWNQGAVLGGAVAERDFFVSVGRSRSVVVIAGR